MRIKKLKIEIIKQSDVVSDVDFVKKLEIRLDEIAAEGSEFHNLQFVPRTRYKMKAVLTYFYEIEVIDPNFDTIPRELKEVFIIDWLVDNRIKTSNPIFKALSYMPFTVSSDGIRQPFAKLGDVTKEQFVLARGVGEKTWNDFMKLIHKIE